MEGYYTARFTDKYTQNYDEFMRMRNCKSKAEYEKNLYKEQFSIM